MPWIHVHYRAAQICLGCCLRKPRRQNTPVELLGSQRDRELLRVEREALEAHRGCEHSRVAREKERRPCRKPEPALPFAQRCGRRPRPRGCVCHNIDMKYEGLVPIPPSIPICPAQPGSIAQNSALSPIISISLAFRKTTSGRHTSGHAAGVAHGSTPLHSRKIDSSCHESISRNFACASQTNVSRRTVLAPSETGFELSRGTSKV